MSRPGLATVELFKTLKADSDRFLKIDEATLRRIQKILLGMAEDIILYCKAEKIDHFLCGGSALGAVRNEGFIPWDDDMDIAIVSKDFERFISGFSLKYKEKYLVQSWNDEDYGMTIGRVRLRNSICRSREDMDAKECGFYVDLFKVENTFDSFLLRNLHGVLCMGTGFLLSCRNFYKNRELMRELETDNPQIRKVFEAKIFLGRLISLLSVKQWAILTAKCYGLCKNDDSRYVSIPSGRKHYFKEMYERKSVCKTKKQRFEDHLWNIPSDHDAYLKTLYGDYMQIPQEDQREKHLILELVFPEDFQKQMSENR